MTIKRTFVACLFAAASLMAAPLSWADLSAYSQDFEGLDASNDGSLAADGWLVFGNVFDGANGNFLYGYGPFGAPNDGSAFSAIDEGQGGPDQGLQQLLVFNDIENVQEHSAGNLVEANVFQEQTIGAADVGQTYTFRFDAKRGNIRGATTAVAFIKTLDPGAGFALTNFVTIDTTNLPDTWDTYALTLFIDAGLGGQIFQLGFASTTTNFERSGNFYDNVSLAAAMDTDADGVVDDADNCTEVANPQQIDSNGDGFGNVCDADLNNDCNINFLDLGQMKAVFFSNNPDADLTGDGAVNFIDLGIMKAEFFAAPGPSALAACP